nr:alpha/beta hydrolase [Haloferula luteola]
MYQRAKITPDDPDAFTEPSDFVGDPFNPTVTPPVPQIGWVWDPNGKPFIEDPEEEKQYLVFVYGWRMTYTGSQKYAESMFKRLWQTGYKGRFAFVRWPTYSEDTNGWTDGLFTYNISDYRAWLSGKGVAAFVNSLPSEYTRNIAAHSMGNVVASSALREEMAVDNYALLHAAIPAMCFDGNSSLYKFDRETPDGDSDPITKSFGFREKISQTNGAKLINFYLEGDSALTGKINVPLVGEVGGWEDNNKSYKPETWGLTGYKYDPDRSNGTKIYIDFLTEFGRHLRLFPESAAYATASRTKAVGAEGRTAGVISDKINMGAKYGFGSTHSAEYLWRIQKTDQFYHDLMEKFGLNPIP